MSRRAPNGLSATARRRWRERVAEFSAANRLTPTTIDTISSWARSLDSMSAAITAWREAGSPRVAAGYHDQEVAHPLYKSVEKARAAEERLNHALERRLRRMPEAESVPEGGRLLSPTQLLLDGRLHVRYEGQWVLSLLEDEADHGLKVRTVNGDGIPTFAMPPPMRRVKGRGYLAPTDAELRDYGKRQDVPLADLRVWREAVLEEYGKAPKRIRVIAP